MLTIFPARSWPILRCLRLVTVPLDPELWTTRQQKGFCNAEAPTPAQPARGHATPSIRRRLEPRDTMQALLHRSVHSPVQVTKTCAVDGPHVRRLTLRWSQPKTGGSVPLYRCCLCFLHVRNSLQAEG